MILELQNVSKRFGGLVAVQGVSFAIHEGEILGLIGPNGAGKTTLFNVVNGVYQPDTGRILFADHDITRMPVHSRARLGIARSHQVVRPLSELSVLDNVTVGACYGRENLGLRSARRRAAEVLAFVRMEAKAELAAGKLNVAEKKRLELARALAASPRLLLLDEVLAGLNPGEVVGMLEVIRTIRSQGITILMIEHLMHAMMNVSDRVVALDYGSKIAEGSPQEVAANPAVIEAYLGDPRLASGVIEVGP